MKYLHKQNKSQENHNTKKGGIKMSTLAIILTAVGTVLVAGARIISAILAAQRKMAA